MSGFGISSFMQGYFLIFLFSALFARFMGDSGAAPSIAVKVARIAKKARGEQYLSLDIIYHGVNHNERNFV